MTFLVQLLAWLVAMFIAAWVFRFAGQRVPWKREALYVYFRDMNDMVAFGVIRFSTAISKKSRHAGITPLAAASLVLFMGLS